MAAAVPSRFPKVVPWSSTEEYKEAADCLYSSNIKERKRGVAIVKAWRARGKVPPAIDATANLTEMVIADTERSTDLTTTQIRHMYAMALIRFVNSIVDLEQKGMYAQSVAMLATRIGMPVWFVELRHVSTHEHIPSLVVLRSACHQALHWLMESYWGRQSRRLPEDTLVQVRDALSVYIQTRELAQNCTVSKPAKRASKEEVVSQISSALTAYDNAKDALSKLISKLHPDAVRLYVVPVLLEPGFLVPNSKKHRSKFPDCQLSKTLAGEWSGVFGMFVESWGEPLFFEELLSGIVDALVPDSNQSGIFVDTGATSISTSYAATLVAWIRWALETHYCSGKIGADDLLEGCLRNPGYYSRAILKVVMDVDSELRGELKPFVDFMGKALAALVSEDTKINKTKTKLLACCDKKFQKEEEELMQTRLNKFFGTAKNKTALVDVEETTPVARSETQELGTNSARWKHMPANMWIQSPIGTLTDGSVPALELPTWFDDIELHMVPT